MFAATLTLRRVWLQVDMKIKLMLLPPINILFTGGWQILIPYEDKADVVTPINLLFIGCGEVWSLMKIGGWRILIPHGDIVYVITPFKILFRGGGEFWSLMKIKLMLLPQSTYRAEGVANFNVMMIMMWWCDDVVVMMMMTIIIMIMIMVMMIMMIVSVEQRPGWGEHV